MKMLIPRRQHATLTLQPIQACGGYGTAILPVLAVEAVSDDAATATAAITELRAAGSAEVDTLMARNRRPHRADALGHHTVE
jgi:hypothetical protein